MSTTITALFLVVAGVDPDWAFGAAVTMGCVVFVLAGRRLEEASVFDTVEAKQGGTGWGVAWGAAAGAAMVAAAFTTVLAAGGFQ